MTIGTDRGKAQFTVVTQGDPQRHAVPFELGDQVELGGRLLKEASEPGRVVFSEGRFYRYVPKRGVFEVLSDRVLSGIVQTFSGAPVQGERGRLKITRAAFDGAKRFAAENALEEGFFAEAVPGVAFADCFVAVTPDGLRKRQHSQEHRARFAYPFPYSTEEPGKLLEFFAEVFGDDEDGEVKVDLLQKYAGLALLGYGTRHQRALVLLGDGANGKGVLSSVLECCMPPGSVCAIPPQELGQEYRRAQLAGKLLNMVSELPEASILESEPWKAAVSGDSMTGREIRGAPFTFRPIAGHIYSANRLPGATDQSHGFWRRLVVLSFNRTFAVAEQNPRLADELVAAEMPAIVGWMIRGAHRAIVAQGLPTPSSSAECMARWRAHADQVLAFVNERCERLPVNASPNDGTPARAVYAAYRQWAEENGHRPLAHNSFGERMRQLGLTSPSHRDVRRYLIRLRNRQPLSDGHEQ